MIQIITYNILKFKTYSEQYKISTFDEFSSFDNYDINVIDLSDKDMWKYSSSNIGGLNNISDLKSVSKELDTVKKAKIIVVFPQNVDYRYDWLAYERKYEKHSKIKDILTSVINIISKNLFKIEGFDISYSKNKTTLNESIYYSDFNFNQNVDGSFSIITKSDISDKVTTIDYNGLIITTLDVISTKESLDNFILFLEENEKGEEAPKWMQDIKFYDDEQLIKDKLSNEERIDELEQKNKKIDKKLLDNDKYKSVLYETGDKLVKVVMEMLDKMLENDSSNFVDKKREDFLIKKETVTFVGEIKGLSSAVSNQYVAQLDVHVQNYMDELQNENRIENVKGLLVINYQRKKKLSERNEIHKNQIDLAKRNEALIISSDVLLKLYEQFLFKKINSDEIIKILSEKIGVLKLEDFVK